MEGVKLVFERGIIQKGLFEFLTCIVSALILITIIGVLVKKELKRNKGEKNENI